MSNALAERDIETVALALESRGVTCLFVKGWAVARSYPNRDLRPYGDIDIVVRDDYEAARTLVGRLAPKLSTSVDVHRGLVGLIDRDFEDVVSMARVEDLGNARVLVPCPEDHARLVAIHLLRHGASRPLWLLDLAIMIDGRAAGFDWMRLLPPAQRLTPWVKAAILLARSLLGLDLSGTPLHDAAAPPHWLERAVLARWSHVSGFGEFQPLGLFTDLRQVLREWRERTPSPIQASLRFGVPPNSWPRWPFQAAEFLVRLRDKPALVTRHLAGWWRLRERRRFAVTEPY